LWPTSDYQGRSPWTETGGNHLVRDPDYTVDAKVQLLAVQVRVKPFISTIL